MKLKKIFTVVVSAMALMCVSVHAEENVKIVLNGETLHQEGQPAVIQNGTTMIPFRTIFEAFDACVDWIPQTKTIVASKGMTSLKMQIGSDKLYLNGEEKTIAKAPVIMNDSTMVPLRTVSEMLEAKVDWNEDAKTVFITTDQTEQAHVSHTEYYTKEYKNDDNILLFKAVAAYPFFEGEEGEKIDNINSLYSSRAREFADEVINQFGEEAKKAHEKAVLEGTVYVPQIMMYQYEISYDKYNYISVVEQWGEPGGDLYHFDALNFDTTTGKVLESTDFVNMTKDELKTLSVYSFYIYDNKVIMFLNSDNIYLYQYNGYPPSMVVPTEYYKFDFAKGESLEWSERPNNEDEQAAIELNGERVKCNTLSELNRALKFNMELFKDEHRNVPIEYSAINGTIGEIVFSRDAGTLKVTLRKRAGDADLSGIKDAELYKEEKYEGHTIKFYQNENEAYVRFMIDIDGEYYSYSIAIDSLDYKYMLIKYAKEMIDIERK